MVPPPRPSRTSLQDTVMPEVRLDSSGMDDDDDEGDEDLDDDLAAAAAVVVVFATTVLKSELVGTCADDVGDSSFSASAFVLIFALTLVSSGSTEEAFLFCMICNITYPIKLVGVNLKLKLKLNLRLELELEQVLYTIRNQYWCVCNVLSVWIKIYNRWD